MLCRKYNNCFFFVLLLAISKKITQCECDIEVCRRVWCEYVFTWGPLMYGATRVSHFQVMMYMTSVNHAHTWHPISIELGTERGSEKEQRNIHYICRYICSECNFSGNTLIARTNLLRLPDGMENAYAIEVKVCVCV